MGSHSYCFLPNRDPRKGFNTTALCKAQRDNATNGGLCKTELATLVLSRAMLLELLSVYSSSAEQDNQPFILDNDYQ